LLGILAAPFLHADFGHLISNTIGIVLLGGLVMAIGRREFLVVTVAGVLVGGLGTWAVGRPAVHIGASGLVFAYLGYLLLRGWYDRRFGSMLLALAVGWFYGSMVFGMLPGFTPTVVSWECHLFGFLGGVLAARQLHKRG
jgi:membrane associated rhomboid family serine protease